MPSPSNNRLEASSRGERGISFEDGDWGVVGEELEAVDLTEDPEESLSSSAVSIATAGKGWETAGLKRKG
jgi:hypothetical protein